MVTHDIRRLQMLNDLISQTLTVLERRASALGVAVPYGSDPFGYGLGFGFPQTGFGIPHTGAGMQNGFPGASWAVPPLAQSGFGGGVPGAYGALNGAFGRGVQQGW